MSDIKITFQYSEGNLNTVITNIESKFSKIKTELNIEVGGYEDTYTKLDTLNSKAKELRAEFRKMFVIDASGGHLGQAAKDFANTTKQVAKENVKLQKEATRNAEKEEKRQQQSIRTQNSQMTSALKMAQRIENYTNRFSSQFAKNKDLRETANKLYSDFSTGKYNDLTGVEQQRKFAQFVNSCRAAGLEAQTLRGQIANLFSQHFSIAAVMVGVHALTNGFRQMYQNVLQIDSALTQLDIVTSANNNTLAKYFEDASKAAQNAGKDISDILNSATSFARLGYQEDAVGLAELTSKYASAGGFDTQEATSGITAVLQAFDSVDTKNLEETLDKMVYVGNNFPISTAELAEGIQNSGSALSAANDSVDGTIALMTAANASVQNIAKSSTALRTISARIRNSQTDLEELGETMEYTTTATYRNAVKAISGIDILESDNQTFKTTYEILKQLSEVWDDLSDIDQASITKLFAGTRQVSIFSSIMDNFSLAEDAMSEMTRASGTLEQANITRLDSIEGRMAQTSAKFQELSTSLINSDFIKGSVSLGRWLIELLTNVSEGFGGLPTLITAASAALSVFFNKGFLHLEDNFDNKSGFGISTFFKRYGTRKSDLSELDSAINSYSNRINTMTEAELQAGFAADTLKDDLSGLSNQTQILADSNLQGAKSAKEQVEALKLTRQSVNNLGISAKIASFGMRTLAMAGNMIVTMGISWAINKLLEGIIWLFNRSEERAEAATEALNGYKEALQGIDDAKSFISDEDKIKEFAELSKGVNHLGENVYLSNEQFERYRELNNEIKSLFPDMVKGYNAQGDAIYTNTKNTKELIKQLKEANNLNLRKANSKLLESADEVIGNVYDNYNTSSWEKFWNTEHSRIEEMAGLKPLVDEMVRVAEAFRAAGNEISDEEIANVYKKFFYPNSLWEEEFTKTELAFTKYARNAGVSKIINERQDDVDTVFDKAGGTYKQLINYQQDLNEEVNQGASELNKLANAYAFNENFDALTGNDDFRELLQNVINNLGMDFYDGVSNYEELQDKIDNLVTPLKKLSPEQQQQYTLAIDATTKFNDGKITYEEYKTKVKAILDIIKKLFPDDDEVVQSFRVIFNWEDTTDQAKRAKNKLRAIDGEDGVLSIKNKDILNGIVNSLNSTQIAELLSGKYDEAIRQFVNNNQNATAEQISKFIQDEIQKALNKQKSKTYDFSKIMTGVEDSLKALKELDKAYGELASDGDISSSTLSGIYDAFKDVKGIENYINKLSEAKGNTEETKKVLNELTQSYVENKIGVENLAHANVDLVESMLEEAGVSNASEAANLMVAKAKYDNAVETGTLTKKTKNEIVALLNEAGATKSVNKFLKIYNYQKQISKKNALDTTESVKNLQNIAKAAGIATVQLDLYAQALEMSESAPPKISDYDGNIGRWDRAYAEWVKNKKNLPNLKKKALKEAKNLSFDIDSLFNFDYTGDGGGKGGSGKNSKSYSPTEDKWLSKREKELAKLKHKHEMGVISEDKYYTEVNKVYKKFAPKIKSKKAQIAKIQEQIAKTKKKSKKEKLLKDLEQLKKELDEIQNKSNELSESIHKNKVDKMKDDYADVQDKYLQDYLDGKIKSLKEVKKKLKKWLKEHAKTLDKDAYKELLAGMPEWIDDARKQKFDKENNNLETLHSLDLMSDKDYYNNKVSVAKKFYKQDEGFKDDYIDSIKNLYEYCKEEYKKDIELQKESLEEQKEILEERKDAIQDFYDKQIELLEEADELDKYYSEQQEKRKSVNDIKSQISQLQRDKDSAVAQKRIKELQSELKDAEDELTEFEKERALQETISMLQEQCNEEIEAIETQIESIDSKIESLDKTLSDMDYNTAGIYNAVAAFAKQKGITYELPSASTIKSWYAGGTSSSVGGLSVTQEKGAEAVGVNIGSGKFTYLTPNSKVISANASKLLYEFANNPNSVLNDLLQDSNKKANAVVQNIANDNTKNTVNVSVNVQGNADNHLINKMSDEIAYKVLETFKKLK